MVEEWRDVIGYESFISVSNMGRVYFKPREYTALNSNVVRKAGDIYPHQNDSRGYFRIKISIDSKEYSMSVHRIVLSAFSPIDGYEELEVNHIDGNKKNNMLSNLEWVTHQENMDHAIATGLKYSPKDNYYINREGYKISYVGSGICRGCKLEFNKKKKTQVFCSRDCVSIDSNAHPYKIVCQVCDEEFNSRKKTAKTCSEDCKYKLSRIVSRPTKDELYSNLLDNPFTKVAIMYGVSDNAIRKWCKSYGIPTKSSYYRQISKK